MELKKLKSKVANLKQPLMVEINLCGEEFKSTIETYDLHDEVKSFKERKNWDEGLTYIDINRDMDIREFFNNKDYEITIEEEYLTFRCSDDNVGIQLTYSLELKKVVDRL